MTFQSTVVVRRLEPADWSVLRTLRLKALRDSPQAFLGDLTVETAQTPAEWQLRMQHQTWFAAMLDDCPAGVASTLRDPETDDRYVESMWVDAEARGHGLASALLEAIERLVIGEGRSHLWLWVLEGNLVAAETYRRYGFRESGRRQAVPDHPQLVETQFLLKIPSQRANTVIPPLFAGR